MLRTVKVNALSDAWLDHQKKLAKQQQRRLTLRFDNLEAHLEVRSVEQFLEHIRLLRHNKDFTEAVDEVIKLHRELVRVHGVGLPCPSEVRQIKGALSVSWGSSGLTVLFHGGDGISKNSAGVLWLLGGTQGMRGYGYRPELLNALKLRALANEQ